MRLVPVELRTNTNQVEFMTGFRICWAELTWLKVHRLLLTCIKTSDRLYQKLLFRKRDGEATIICMHFFFINNQCTSKFSAPTRSCDMAWSQFCSPVEISFLLVFSIEIVSWASSSLSFIDTSANLDFLDFSVLCTTKLQAECWCQRKTIPVYKCSWATYQGLL